MTNKNREKNSLLKQKLPVAKLFDILDDLILAEKNLENPDWKKIAKIHNVSTHLLCSMRKFLESNVRERDIIFSNKCEVLANTLLENITKREIRKSKLYPRIQSVETLVKLKQLLRGDATDRLGIDWSQKSEEDMLEYLKR